MSAASSTALVCAGSFAAVYAAARADGPGPALAALAELLGLPQAHPGPHGVAVTTVARSAADPAALLRRFPLPGGDVCLVTAPDQGPDQGPGPAPTADRWPLGLLWLRLGLSEGCRDVCTKHLSGRLSGAIPIINYQLVKGQLADILVTHLEVAATLAADPGGPPAPARNRLHREISAADRSLTRLFGAAGYLREGPGDTAYVSELIAAVHTPASPPEEETW